MPRRRKATLRRMAGVTMSLPLPPNSYPAVSTRPVTSFVVSADIARDAVPAAANTVPPAGLRGQDVRSWTWHRMARFVGQSNDHTLRHRTRHSARRELGFGTLRLPQCNRAAPPTSYFVQGSVHSGSGPRATAGTAQPARGFGGRRPERGAGSLRHQGCKLHHGRRLGR